VGLAGGRWRPGEGALAPKTATPASAVGPADRGKNGSKRHVLTEGRGVPLATIVTAANVNDHTALPALLAARIMVAPARLERPGLCLDAGYDNGPTEDVVVVADYTPHIRRQGEARPAHDPRVAPRRWPVERVHAWHNRFRRLLIRWEKKAANWLALVHFANALIAFRACSW
jgi:putative transposase